MLYREISKIFREISKTFCDMSIELASRRPGPRRPVFFPALDRNTDGRTKYRRTNEQGNRLRFLRGIKKCPSNAPYFKMPGGMMITGAMLQFYKSVPAVVFWQWFNQSFNALVSSSSTCGLINHLML